MRKTSTTNPVLVIYTGGTIGMALARESDATSPLVARPSRSLARWVPQTRQLGFPIRHVSIRHPVDSSNITPAEWTEIAQIIADQYDRCRGVVVLHGTDTMAYTATALGFILRRLAKPVVVTGAQLPISTPGTDAVQNLVNALRIAAGEAAGVPCVPEVCLFFRDQLLRGCRATKVSANGFDAFASPNYPPLATVDQKITVHIDRVRKPPQGRLQLRSERSGGVIALRVTPGMNSQLIRHVIMHDDVRGVVLQTFGAGNVPTRDGLLDAVAEAVSAGKTVVNVTQCPRGRVEEGLYEGSARLRDLGVISGGDMTTEAAVIKLQMALAEYGASRARISEAMRENWVGERSAS